MTSPRVIWHLMLADMRERTRRYGFLITMIASVYLAYAVFDDEIVLDLDHHRGIYNSAWLGMLLAMATTMFVSLAGFYVIKNTIQRDRQTRVGEVLATTPIRKLEYILGKVLSNFAVLMIIVGVQIVAALVMQVFKSEESAVDLAALLLPFVLLTMPAMAFIAALAVLFESIRWLRGGFGNVFYLFLWGGMLAYPIETQLTAADLPFLRPVQQSMETAIRMTDTTYHGGFSLSAGGGKDAANIGTFVWEGMRWTGEIVGIRAAWFGYALLLAAAAALLFDRFDTSRMSGLGRLRRAQGAEKVATAKKRRARFRFGGRVSFRSRFLQMSVAEFSLMVRGLPFWWYGVSLGLFIASVAAPLATVKEFILPILWLWPVLQWSGMGVRERLHRTDQIVFSTPRVLTRQLPALLAAGAALAVLMAGGAAIRLAAGGDWSALGGLAAGALFIPSFALASAVWTGSSKTFEAVYTLMWYLGPMQHLPALDFVGVSTTAIEAGMPATFAGVAVLLILAAFAGRRRQLGMA